MNELVFDELCNTIVEPSGPTSTGSGQQQESAEENILEI